MHPNLVKICPVAETENRISSIHLHINHFFLNLQDDQETRGKREKETEKYRRREGEKDHSKSRERLTEIEEKRGILDQEKREEEKKRGRKMDRESFQITNGFSTLIPNVRRITVGSNLWERDWSGPIAGRTCHGRYK